MSKTSEKTEKNTPPAPSPEETANVIATMLAENAALKQQLQSQKQQNTIIQAQKGENPFVVVQNKKGELHQVRCRGFRYEGKYHTAEAFAQNPELITTAFAKGFKFLIPVSGEGGGGGESNG